MLVLDLTKRDYARALARIEMLAREFGLTDAQRVALERQLWLATRRADDGAMLRA